MRKIFIILLLGAALLSCSQRQASQKAEQKGEYLAKVGSATISQGDFYNELDSLPEYARTIFQGENGKDKFLEEVIKKNILYQQALKEGLDKDPSFTKKVDEFKKLTLISTLLERQIMTKSKAGDKEVREYYDKHKKDFTTTSQIKASHILVKTEPEAQKALARIRKGEKFEAVAKEMSIDKPSASNGGDLGYFSRGQMVPEFEGAAARLSVGEVSDPVKTNFGYHIIKVTGKKSGPVVEFDKVKDVIAQRLTGERQKEAFDKYLTELKKSYPVEINKAALEKVSLERADNAGGPKPGAASSENKQTPKSGK